MNWLTIAVQIFDVFWLAAVLVLLWLIWRSSTRHIHKMESTLVEVAMMDAQSARKAVEVAQGAVKFQEKLTETLKAPSK